jgi:DnaJ-domain-containing protein 1
MPLALPLRSSRAKTLKTGDERETEANLKSAVETSLSDHYATLGLDRRCTEAQIRAAYRLLAKQLHPDVNGGSPAALAQTQALNAAYETLSDPARRQQYDRQLTAREQRDRQRRPVGATITQPVHLRPEEFLRGTTLEVRVDDPGQPDGPERCELVVPPDTAPGTRFRLPRRNGGFVVVRVQPRPDSRFKVRGADVRCDLRIRPDRARQGGVETVRGLTGNLLRVLIPPRVARGEIIRLPNEGLPRASGRRGDLLVRVLYQPNVQVRRRMRG